tara:strand:- start:6124 stop:7374 length:1251 start_codon:yes stop_codon:yes gene_type:complete
VEDVAEVVVIGAGIAGLRCAIELQSKGIQTIVLDASDRVGGRMKTDLYDGFRLDRGFQVLLTAYDECSSVLDYDTLKLGAFEPGALVWTGSRMEKLIDPWRRPRQLLTAALSPVGSFQDKLRVGGLREKLRRKAVSTIYEGEEKSTLEKLKEIGFSTPFIETFFRPFYGGIFLENDLSTGSKMFEFVFKMFGQGYAALPQDGISSIPLQLSKRLNPNTVRTKQRVVKLAPNNITTEEGSRFTAQHIVLATDMNSANKLAKIESLDRDWNGTYCHYYAARNSPLPEPVIALNGSGKGDITNIAVPTDVNRGYASDGESLICVSTSKPVSKDELAPELYSWFGNVSKDFRFLADYSIPHALPRQLPSDNAYGKAELRSPEGHWICGDYRYSSSVQGAMASGRMVGEAVCKEVIRLGER